MPVEFTECGAFCKYCGQNRLFRSATTVPNHVLHAILTIATLGLWAIVWLISAIAAGSSTPWRCTACGGDYHQSAG